MSIPSSKDRVPKNVGAQPGDPAWVRLLFVMVEGQHGQWWRALLLVALVGLVGAALLAALAPALAGWVTLAGWVGSALGIGSLTAGMTALAWRRKRTPR